MTDKANGLSKEQFLSSLASTKIDNVRVNKLSTIYDSSIPKQIQKIISANNGPVFLNNGIRILSFNEIMDAEKDLQTDFVNKRMIPIADCGENDFVVYNLTNKTYSKFNINDKSEFKKSSNLKQVLESDISLLEIRSKINNTINCLNIVMMESFYCSKSVDSIYFESSNSDDKTIKEINTKFIKMKDALKRKNINVAKKVYDGISSDIKKIINKMKINNQNKTNVILKSIADNLSKYDDELKNREDLSSNMNDVSTAMAVHHGFM